LAAACATPLDIVCRLAAQAFSGQRQQLVGSFGNRNPDDQSAGINPQNNVGVPSMSPTLAVRCGETKQLKAIVHLPCEQYYKSLSTMVDL
jgi:hypothetical protein